MTTNNDTSLALRAALESSLESSSLKGLAREAETVMLLIDTSSSMGGQPVRDLRKVVANIQAAGHVPMIAFGGPYDAMVRFVDAVPDPAGGTPLHMAIPFAKEYGATRVVVVSDGAPDLPAQCMIEADAFVGRIDVCYVGGEYGGGKTFLAELAQRTGGRQLDGDLTKTDELTGQVILLLEGDVEPERAPIQGEGFTATEDVPDDDDDDDDDEEEEEDDDDDDDEA
jgi:hypothetical protein